MGLQTGLFTYIVLQCQQIIRLEGALAQKEQQMTAAQRQLAYYQQQLADRDEQIALQTQQLAYYQQQLAEKDAELTRQAQNLTVYQQQLADRDAQIALQAQQLTAYQDQQADRDAALVQQEQAMQVLRVRLNEVEAILRQNSKNSSKPPSTDQKSQSTKKDLKPAIPKASTLKRGGQPGHKGTTLLIPTKVDHEQDCQPHVCSNPNCGHGLSEATLTQQSVRYVIDLPVTPLVVTAYNQLSGYCPVCGQFNQGTYPPEVKATVQYGPRVKTLAVYMSVQLNVPYKKIERMFREVYDCSLNVSTIKKAIDDCYQNLKTTESSIRSALSNVPVLHVDETGLRTDDRKQWLHVRCTSRLTYIYVHEKRGAAAIVDYAESGLQDYQGTIVHDCWASYYKLPGVSHALCNAHLLRELQGLIENDPEKCMSWARQMHALLLQLFKLSDNGCGIVEGFTPYAVRYDEILEVAESEEPLNLNNKGHPAAKQSKGRNLLKRLRNRKDQVLAFAVREEVPFTNNQAERDLRHTKSKENAANCFRTLGGAKCFARILSVISTLKKQGMPVFETLVQSWHPHFKPPIWKLD